MTDLERVIKIVDWLIFEKVVKSRRELAEVLGYTESSMSQILNGKVTLSERFIKKLSTIDDRINEDWIRHESGNMLKTTQVITNESGVLINGDNTNSPIDNRHYYSDSPDVLRAQIELLDERIKEKDAQIKEKDAQIKEKDAQIKSLLDIISKFNS
ncbi:MAG: XRE family transcriptional regulator [Bacteroidales bacterium]|nr:XRE family transcriptional regulator [Bacteroidales bacterium]